MFYEVRVKDANGKVKKVISSKSLSAQYWRNLDLKLDMDFSRMDDGDDEVSENQMDVEPKRRRGRRKKMLQAG